MIQTQEKVMSSLENQEKKSNKWLKKLKNESWEAELLVSAIAIFGTTRLFSAVGWTSNMFINHLAPSQYKIGYMIVFMGLLAISILVSMFVIHFILRAYWIGLVGLNSVFPDYSIKNSPYSEIYTEKMANMLPKLKESVVKVDEICSVIFSAAFALLIMYFFTAFTATIYLFTFNLLSEHLPLYILIIPIIIIVIAVTLQTVISIIANIKRYKQHKTIQNWYFYIVKYCSMILIGPLYKAVMQITMIFGSNFKKKKAMMKLIIAFLCSGIFISIYQISQTNIPYLIASDVFQESYNNTTKTHAEYYKSENKEVTFLLAPEIQSDIIETHTLKLFIPIYKYEDTLRKETCGEYTENENKSRQEQRIEKTFFYLDCYKAYNHIYLNNKKITTDFLKYTHSKTGQMGIIAYIPLQDQTNGHNILEIKKIYGNDNDTQWRIPFYYAPKNYN